MTYEFMLQVVVGPNPAKAVATDGGTEFCKLHLGNPVIQNIVRNPPKDPPYDAMFM
ncbi:hypothetical protein X777_00011, partial [Ooceraea biroi]